MRGGMEAVYDDMVKATGFLADVCASAASKGRVCSLLVDGHTDPANLRWRGPSTEQETSLIDARDRIAALVWAFAKDAKRRESVPFAAG